MAVGRTWPPEQQGCQWMRQFPEKAKKAAQLTSKRSTSSLGSGDLDAVSEKVTNEGLQECKNSLALTAAKLERHMKDLIDRLVMKSQTTTTSQDEVADLGRLRDEWETTRQCMDICSKADNHLKENVSVIDNYATGDAVQFMVSTNGKILHGKNQGTGWRTRQVGGYLSDAAVMHLSRDISGLSLQNIGKDGILTRGDGSTSLGDAAENVEASDFGERWGRGFTLVSKSTTEETTPSMEPADSGQHSSLKR